MRGARDPQELKKRPIFLRHRSGRLVPIPIPYGQDCDAHVHMFYKAKGARTTRRVARASASRKSSDPSQGHHGSTQIRFGSIDEELALSGSSPFASPDPAADSEVNCPGFGSSSSLTSSTLSSITDVIQFQEVGLQPAAVSQANLDTLTLDSDAKSAVDSLGTPLPPEQSFLAPQAVPQSKALSTHFLLASARASSSTAFGLLSVTAGGRFSPMGSRPSVGLGGDSSRATPATANDTEPMGAVIQTASSTGGAPSERSNAADNDRESITAGDRSAGDSGAVPGAERTLARRTRHSLDTCASAAAAEPAATSGGEESLELAAVSGEASVSEGSPHNSSSSAVGTPFTTSSAAAGSATSDLSPGRSPALEASLSHTSCATSGAKDSLVSGDGGRKGAGKGSEPAGGPGSMAGSLFDRHSGLLPRASSQGTSSNPGRSSKDAVPAAGRLRPEVSSGPQAASADAVTDGPTTPDPLRRVAAAAVAGMKGLRHGTPSALAYDGGDADGSRTAAAAAGEEGDPVTVPPHCLPSQLQVCLRYVYGTEATAAEVAREAPPPYLTASALRAMSRWEYKMWYCRVEAAWYSKLRHMLRLGPSGKPQSVLRRTASAEAALQSERDSGVGSGGRGGRAAAGCELVEESDKAAVAVACGGGGGAAAVAGASPSGGEQRSRQSAPGDVRCAGATATVTAATTATTSECDCGSGSDSDGGGRGSRSKEGTHDGAAPEATSGRVKAQADSNTKTAVEGAVAPAPATPAAAGAAKPPSSVAPQPATGASRHRTSWGSSRTPSSSNSSNSRYRLTSVRLSAASTGSFPYPGQHPVYGGPVPMPVPMQPAPGLMGPFMGSAMTGPLVQPGFVPLPTPYVLPPANMLVSAMLVPYTPDVVQQQQPYGVLHGGVWYG